MSGHRRGQAVRQPADWDRMWSGLSEQADDLDAELASLRFKTQERLAERQFGSLHGLRVIEIEAGGATNALLYALRGAEATVLDASTVALEQSVRRFEARGLEVRTIHSDVFELPSDVRESFDISMSFGLCEHFSGERRRRVIAAHVELPKPSGIAMVNVPNRLSPVYRLRMDLSKRRGTWSLGYEAPFSSRELVKLGRKSGRSPLRPIYLGGLGTLINQGPNALPARIRRSPLPVSQTRIPGLDYPAYDLLMPIIRPGGTSTGHNQSGRAE
jgi:hypothetical protein